MWVFSLIFLAIVISGCAQKPKKKELPKAEKVSEYERLREKLRKDFEDFLKKAKCIQRRCNGWTEVRM